MNSRVNPDDLLGEVIRPSGKPPVLETTRVAGAGGREFAIAGEAYDGASRYQREVATWVPPSQSVDRDIIPNKRLADARVRDMMRNDGYVQSGAMIRQNTIVGGHYMLNARPVSQILFGKHDDTWEEEFQEEVEVKFSQWAESDECWPDASRRQTFTGLVRQVVGMDVAYGESLSIAEWSREDDSLRTHNTSVRLIDMDRLSTPHNQIYNSFIIGGVQVNARHIPEGYHIRKAHPRDHFITQSQEWEFVPVRLPWGRRQALHIFEGKRPGQTRGISDMVAGLMEMRMTKDFRATVLQNAYTQATYAATIESDLDTKEIFARLGGGNLGEDEINNAIVASMSAYLGAVESYLGDAKQLQLNGVRIPHLPPGSKLNMQKPGNGGPLGTEFEQSLIRYLARILDVSYEQLSGDYTATNYSSARAANVEIHKGMMARKKMTADRFANMVYRLWLEESLNKGYIETSKSRRLANWYAPGMADAYTNCDWIGPGRGQIDELKETQAATLRNKYNFSTAEDEIGRTGKDYRRVYRQLAREKAMRKELDIEPETDDNQMNASTGATREKALSDLPDVIAMSNAQLAAYIDSLVEDEEKEDV